MWVSKHRFEELESDLKRLRQETNRYSVLIDLYGNFKNTLEKKIDDAIGVRIIECSRDHIEAELFNKLKDKLFNDKKEM